MNINSGIESIMLIDFEIQIRKYLTAKPKTLFSKLLGIMSFPATLVKSKKSTNVAKKLQASVSA